MTKETPDGLVYLRRVRIISLADITTKLDLCSIGHNQCKGMECKNECSYLFDKFTGRKWHKIIHSEEKK